MARLLRGGVENIVIVMRSPPTSDGSVSTNIKDVYVPTWVRSHPDVQAEYVCSYITYTRLGLSVKAMEKWEWIDDAHRVLATLAL